MIYRVIIAAVLIVSTVFIAPTMYGAMDHEEEIALVYTNESEDTVLVANILGQMTKTEKIHIDEVDKDSLNQYDGLVFIATDYKQLSQKAIDELNSFQKKALVIGNDALQLQPFKDWQLKEEVEIKQVDNHILTHSVEWKEVVPSSNTEVLKNSQSFQREFPFLVKMKDRNWSYMAMIPKEREVMDQLPKILSSLMELSLPTNHEVFIVLSDINAKTDVTTLKSKINILKQYNVPIHLEIASMFIDEKDGLSYYIQDNRKLLDYLKKLQQDGVTFILSEQVESLEKGLHYFAMNKVYPMMTANNSMVFSSRVQENHLYMYPEENKQFNYTVPIMIGNGDYPLYEMEKVINQLYSVPGTTISMRYPNYLSEDHLISLIHLFNRNNSMWVDFKKMELSVQTDKIQMNQDASGTVTIKQSFRFFDRLHMMFERHLFELGLWILIIIVSLFVLLFFINTLRLRIVLRKRLFEERKQHG